MRLAIASLWHALIGAIMAQIILSLRNHASPGVDLTGKPFYGPYDAQELVEQHRDELGVGVVLFHELVHLPDEQRYEEVSKVPHRPRQRPSPGHRYANSTSAMEYRYPPGSPVPKSPKSLPKRIPHGTTRVCIWFTGLSGAGKSTTADVLTVLLLEHGRQVTILDGDVVVRTTSQGLGSVRKIRIPTFAASVLSPPKLSAMVGWSCVKRSQSLPCDAQRCALPGWARTFYRGLNDTPLEGWKGRDTKGMAPGPARG